MLCALLSNLDYLNGTAATQRTRGSTVRGPVDCGRRAGKSATVTLKHTQHPSNTSNLTSIDALTSIPRCDGDVLHGARDSAAVHGLHDLVRTGDVGSVGCRSIQKQCRQMSVKSRSAQHATQGTRHSDNVCATTQTVWGSILQGFKDPARGKHQQARRVWTCVRDRDSEGHTVIINQHIAKSTQRHSGPTHQLRVWMGSDSTDAEPAQCRTPVVSMRRSRSRRANAHSSPQQTTERCGRVFGTPSQPATQC